MSMTTLTDIDEKIAQLRFGLQDIKDAWPFEESGHFLSRFTGFANNMAAVRQYIIGMLIAGGVDLRHGKPVTAGRIWFYDLDTNLDFKGLIELRHVDQHQIAVAPKSDVHVKVTVSFGGAARIATFLDMTEPIPDNELGGTNNPIPVTPDAFGRIYHWKPTAGFMVNTKDAPARFGLPGQPGVTENVLKGHGPRIGPFIEAHLQKTDLQSLADQALTALEDAVAVGKSVGYLK